MLTNAMTELSGMTLPWAIFAICAAFTFTVVTVIWLAGFAHGNHSVMDAYYGWGYALVSWITFLYAGPSSQTAALLLLMASLHGCRLGFYLSRRWRHYRATTGGDARYINFTRQFSPGYWWKSYLLVLQPQTVVIMVISLPIVFGIAGRIDGGGPVGWLTWLGAAIFGVGLYFEWIGDGQLQAFKADPHNKGRYLETGVWSLTRHPNYFGNVTVWWGIWLVAVDGDWSIWWTVVGPLFNTFMLTAFLGATFQDRWMGARVEYQELMRRRSRFFPWPSR